MSCCHNNPKKSSTNNINKHTASGYSLLKNCCLSDTTKNKLDYCRNENCMKNVCLDLRERATKIINCVKKEMIPLTNEERKLHRQ